MRVFFDTNVLASSLMGRGLCRDLLGRVVIEHSVVLGVPVRDELRRVLAAKFRVPDALLRELGARLDEFEQAPSSPAALSVVISDTTDVPILACALAAGVDVFVTGDKALLYLGNIDAMPILSPLQLWIRISERPAN